MQQIFSGRVTWLSSLLKETIDAQLFARSEHAPDQTELQPQHLQCSNDLSPACAIMPVFHAVSRVEGPYDRSQVFLPFADNYFSVLF
jgi:hypothetical protein